MIKLISTGFSSLMDKQLLFIQLFFYIVIIIIILCSSLSILFLFINIITAIKDKIKGNR